MRENKRTSHLLNSTLKSTRFHEAELYWTPQSNKKSQNIMDETTDKNITAEALRDDSPAAEAELEDQDFLLLLTVEERECLKYLLETIESLEVDLSEEDEPTSEIHSNETAHNSPDGKDECNSPTTISKQSRLQKGQVTLGESETIAQRPKDSKVKLSKSFSEDSTGEPVTAGQESLHKLVSLHPSYLKKFDTIIMSGVNVQQLKARFANQNGASALEEETKATETSSSKQVLQFLGNHTSPREKALKKLGLLQRNQTILNTNSSPEASYRQAQSPSDAVQTTDGVSHIVDNCGSSSMTNSGSSSMSSDETDHQEALKKLRLLHF